MSPAAQYFKAARPEPPRIIGLQLRPYSLGHHVALHAYDSSFVKGSPDLFSDMILGVFICSQSWADWEAWRQSWKLPVFLKLWGKLAGKFDVKKEAERFTTYVHEGSFCPEAVTPTKGRELGAPWEARIQLFLLRELRLKFAGAMDFPLALAWQLYCAHHEAEGGMRLLTEAEIQQLDEQKTPDHRNRMAALMVEAEEAARREAEEMKAKAAAQNAGGN